MMMLAMMLWHPNEDDDAGDVDDDAGDDDDDAGDDADAWAAGPGTLVLYLAAFKC